jgi:large subunit ribosomal protein L22
MKFEYSYKDMKENMAKATGRDLGISTKKTVEICNALKGKTVEKAKRYLERVTELKQAVPMKRFKRDTGHKPGMAAGRYPIKTAEGVLTILKSAESNAQNKGLSTKDMVIVHMCAHTASKPWHYGRKSRQKMKRTNLEIVLAEQKSEKTEKTHKKEVNKK